MLPGLWDPEGITVGLEKKSDLILYNCYQINLQVIGVFHLEREAFWAFFRRFIKMNFTTLSNTFYISSYFLLKQLPRSQVPSFATLVMIY